jgi:hypothetical protein
MKYAIINNAEGYLENIVLWDGDTSKWQPPAGVTAVPLDDIDISTLPPKPSEAPAVTAEEFLTSVGLGGNRQPTLLYLRQAGAQSPKLDATELYLNQILALFAADPAPRSDWPTPVYTFEETVAEAVQSLTPVTP